MPREHSTQFNPFPGLRPFSDNEEYLFFGRESQVDAMVDKLAATRFLAVVGASGCGKSSLVNCGLFPALHRGLMTSAGSSWRIAKFRPGHAPLRAMAAALAKDNVLFSGPESPALPRKQVVQAVLSMGKLGLVDLFEQAPLADGDNLLVVVDQFEELFRYADLGTGHSGAVGGTNTLEQAIAFVNLLLEPRHTARRIYIVLTMRSDFLGDCAQFAQLPEAINAGLYLVPRMTRDERRSAISGPAAVGGAEITPVLLTRLVNDVGDNPDQLSVLQHALNRTWDNWESGDQSGPLDLPHYERIGGMAGALDEHAEQAYLALTLPQQDLCARIFKSLTDTATDPRGTRRPTMLSTMCTLTGADQSEVAAVLDAFRDPSRSFLMPPAGTPLLPDTVIDISHESLMRVWKRLKTWTDEEARSAQTYRRLAETAELFSARKHLLQDPELQMALNWRTEERPTAAWALRYHPAFDGAMAFLDRSETQRSQERADAEQERHRQLRRAWTVSVVFAALFAVSVGLAVFARRAQNEADAQRRMAVTAARTSQAQQTRDTNPALAALLLAGLEGYPEALDSAATALSVLLERIPSAILQVPDGGSPMNSVLFSPDGQSLITASDDGTARIWRVDGTGSPRDLAHRATATPAATGSPVMLGAVYDAGGSHIATYSRDATAQLWAADGTRRFILPHDHTVNTVAFNSDGRLLATTEEGSTNALIWDTASGQPVLLSHDTVVRSASFSPPSRFGERVLTLAAGGDCRIWTLRAGEPPTGRAIVLAPALRTAVANTAAFSPDGATVAIGSRRGSVWLLRADGSDAPVTAPLQLPDESGAIRALAFAPDGRNIAAIDSGGAAWLWNPVSGDRTKLDHPAGVRVERVVFSPSSDNAAVATAADDGVARLWSWTTAGWTGPTLLRGHDGSVSDLAFSRDGQRLATASRDGTARVWQTSATWPSLVARLGGNVQHAAFGSGGEQAAVVGDGSLSSWRIDHDASTQWSAEVSVAAIRDLEVQQTGQIVAVPKEGNVLVWDRTGRQVGPDAATHQRYSGPPGGPAERVVWGPQGARALVIAGGKATLWTVRNGQRLDPRPLDLPPEALASAAAFDAAGSQVVVGSTKGMFVWRLPEAPGAVRELPRVPLPVVGDTATFAMFSRDGSRIVALDALGRGRVFSAEGRGTPVDLGELPLKAVTFEGDGSHVLGVSSDGRLVRWPVRWDAVIAALGTSTNACLTTEQRLRFLGESESTAVDQFEACKTGRLTRRDGAEGTRRD